MDKRSRKQGRRKRSRSSARRSGEVLVGWERSCESDVKGGWPSRPPVHRGDAQLCGRATAGRAGEPWGAPRRDVLEGGGEDAARACDAKARGGVGEYRRIQAEDR